MNLDCEVIRDLLPLYADDACSEKSREMVEEHLQGCPDCCEFLDLLRQTELETDLRSEKESVIQYAVRRFRRRSAAVGGTVSGLFMIPILICLVLNLVTGPSLSWVSVVVAAMLVLASLIVVPIVMPEDKLFWTFCAFTASLLLLMGVTALYSHGDWFGIAASAILFGLYLYIPLGGNRRGRARAALNRFIVFLCTGIWHGANWTFVFWGLAHGLLSSAEDWGLIPVKRLEKSRAGRLLCRVYTMLCVTLLFAIFRADSLSDGFRLIAALFTRSVTAEGSLLR